MTTKSQPTTTVAVRVSQQMKDDLENSAALLGLTTSQFTKNVLQVGLDEFNTLQKFGVIRTCVFLQSIWESLPKKARVIKIHQEAT